MRTWILYLFVPVALACGAPGAGAPVDVAEAGSDPGPDGAEPESADPEVVTPELVEETLFVAGQEGYLRFRIPALIETSGATVLAFCEGRHSGIYDTGDIDLVMKASPDGGTTWGPLQVVVDHGVDTAGNPAPVVLRGSGEVWLPFCTNPADAPRERRVHLTRSPDDGATWSPPTDLTDQVKLPAWTHYATGPGRSIQLAGGRIVVPCNHVDGTDGTSRSHVIFSDDGETWHLGGSLRVGTDEAQVAELDDGSLLLNARDLTETHRRVVARSTDGGLSWAETAFDQELLDPSCQGSLLQTPRGLLFSNPASERSAVRAHLTVRRSLDGGRTWAASRVLHDGPAAYSALALTPDGEIACLYEAGDTLPILPYDRIVLARFPFGWLASDAGSRGLP